MALGTTFHTAAGTLELTDAMELGHSPDPHRLGERAPHTLLRGVSCTTAGRCCDDVPAASRIRIGRARFQRVRVRFRGHGWVGPADAVHARESRRSEWGDQGPVHARCRRRSVLRPSPHDLGESLPPAYTQDEIDAGLDVTMRAGGPGRSAPELRGSVARPGAPQRPGAAGADLPAQRRDRRRADHVAARGASAASATGTTATPGCATPASPWRRCGSPPARTRPSDFFALHDHRRGALDRPGRPRCRSCSASAASTT